MALIKGITILLYEKEKTGTDDFNRDIYTGSPVEVENVLVAPLSETEILDTMNLTGRRAVYQLGIPKGDEHNWTDKKVEFFGETWHTIGDVQQGIEAMIPLEWNKKVRVEKFNG